MAKKGCVGNWNPFTATSDEKKGMVMSSSDAMPLRPLFQTILVNFVFERNIYKRENSMLWQKRRNKVEVDLIHLNCELITSFQEFHKTLTCE